MSDEQLRATMRARIRGEMPRDQLQGKIVELLASQTMCVISTCSPDAVPRATPVEYYSDGVDLYMTLDPGRKVDNLRANERISVGICNQIKPDWMNLQEWAGTRSMQITGTAKFLVLDSPEWVRAHQVYKYWVFAQACGVDAEAIDRGRIYIKVTPEKIEYMDFGLKILGFGSRQVWIPDKQ